MPLPYRINGFANPRLRLALWLVCVMAWLPVDVTWAQPGAGEVVSGSGHGAEKPKSVGGFGEAPRGDVPEGTLELMTSETDRAIRDGLSWLARSQKPDGSFGEGTYRGNIAVTSLSGLALMSSGSSPGRGPYGREIERALAYVMDNTSPSGFVAVASAATKGPLYSNGFGTMFLAEA